jgi:hypothetical protein
VHQQVNWVRVVISSSSGAGKKLLELSISELTANACGRKSARAKNQLWPSWKQHLLSLAHVHKKKKKKKCATYFCIFWDLCAHSSHETSLSAIPLLTWTESTMRGNLFDQQRLILLYTGLKRTHAGGNKNAFRFAGV